jgi:TRAP-type C4-dicarboxylate transport system permease small subunit
MNGFNKAVNTIDRLVLGISGLALVLMMLHISVDVVSNLVLGSPVPLTNAAVTQYYMIAVAYLPLAAGELRSMHIRVNLIVDRLPGRLRRQLDHAMQLICMVVYASLALQAWQLAMQKLDSNSFLMEQTTRVSTWPSYAIIPFGFGLIALLFGLRVLFRLLRQPETDHAVLASHDDTLTKRFRDE